MIRVAAVIVTLATPSAAQVVRVTTGEHGDFTRLVLQLPAAQDWKLNRQQDGYQLSLATAQRFDLTQVYRPIGRDRLATIWADPATSALRLGVGCECHAIPFEYRPGIIVIDLHDGPAPAGSVFELAADGSVLAPLAARPTLRPRARPLPMPQYDWLAARDDREAALPSPPPFAPDPRDEQQDPADMLALRETLLHQMSRGAAQGVVELRLPSRPAGVAPDLPLAQVLIQSAPGLGDATVSAPLDAAGNVCPGPDRLALQDWMTDTPVAGQFGSAMSGLSGEFDRPDPDAIARAARFLLALGFGAEVRSLLDAFPTDNPDVGLWRSLSYILDDEGDPAPAFRDMAACDGPAALWSLLDGVPPVQGQATATGAMLQAFSALPQHLRLQLGPRLASVLLDMDRADLAESVRASVERAAPRSTAQAALMAADIALYDNRPAQAQTDIATVAATPGPAMALGLATLVEARVAQGLPIAPDQVAAIEALLNERDGDAEATRLKRALVLARAGSGDFEAAFEALPRAPEMAPELWALLAKSGDENALLRHAIPNGPTPAAMGAAAVIATRLADLGLGKAAQPWIAAMSPPDPRIAARAALAEMDGRNALRAIAGLSDDDAQELRARALELIGDEEGAANAYASPSDRDDATLRARNWPQVAATGPEPWRTAALLVAEQPQASPVTPATPADAPIDGRLTEARELVEKSAAARSTLERLLQDTRIGGQ